MNIVTKLLSTAVGLTMSAGLALAEPAIIFDLGVNLINHSMSLLSQALSDGQMKPVGHSEK